MKTQIWRGSIMVSGMISSAEVGPIVHFHSNINASVYKELLHQRALPHLCKGTVETPIFMQDNSFSFMARCVKFPWRGRNSCYEVATTKPRYESSREFFFSLYIDLTRIYNAFLNFWPAQNVYFCFFQLTINLREK